MNRNQISWWLWAIGTVLIALSWFDVVSGTVGWCGFGIGMIGSVLGWGVVPPRGNPPPEGPEADGREKERED
ncbi:hypothetical protein OJ996_23385 [Luteolibacter sp. GHJ8]|uniref:Uncharacterized protein n=1 Tax=Luteolibacter rhizosphaerae TaxID=2989719 RepID=A0ABT3GBD0_9BACT|nr:hypothetical protein [Luteolibacter rhizosphaerae]MCW1916550.1 hypothetical protein [Luteolibacter rhizosphaerae]